MVTKKAPNNLWVILLPDKLHTLFSSIFTQYSYMKNTKENKFHILWWGRELSFLKQTIIFTHTTGQKQSFWIISDQKEMDLKDIS